MANRAAIGNVVLGLGVIGLGALVIAEHGLSGGTAAPPPLAAVPAPIEPIPAHSQPIAAHAHAPAPAPVPVPAPAPAPAPGPVATVPLPPAGSAAPAPATVVEDELSCDAPLDGPAGRAAATSAVAAAAVARAADTTLAAGASPDSATTVPAALGARLPAARVVRYVVKPGDTLLGLARANKITIGLIRRLNGLRADDMLRSGKTIALPQGPFRAAVDRKTFTLSIFLDDFLVQKYAIGVGRAGSTPTGEFEVRSRVENPEWTSPEGEYFKSGDPLNPLGSRWIGLGDGGYGLHGTTDPGSIGREASRGCVRLNDRDVFEVYDFLTLGSKVTIE